MMKNKYEDIRMSQRLTYENSHIDLTNLWRKFQSFITQKTPKLREKQKNDLLHQDNVLQSQSTRSQFSLTQYGRDPSKNLVNKIPHLNSVALCDTGVSQVQNERERIDNDLKRIILKFLQRFKNEHEDEQSMNLDIIRINKEKSKETQELNSVKQIFLELFSKMLLFIEREKTMLEQLGGPPIDEQLQMAERVLSNIYNLNNPDFIRLVEDLSIIEKQIIPCLESRKGSTLINFWPQLKQFSLVAHPLLLALYSCLKSQMKVQQKKSANRQNNRCINDSFNSGDGKIETSKMIEETIFKQICEHNCSRITFINLDGYDSPLNLMLVKSLNKHIQYISFPIDSLGNLTKHYILDNSTLQWNQNNQIFTVGQSPKKELKEYYQNLFVFPLNYPQQKREEEFIDIAPYHSKFISFILKELIYPQIRNYSPSIIVVSHSGKLHLESQHLEFMFKELSLLSNMKVVLYNNFVREVREQTMKYCPKNSMDKRDEKIWAETGMRNEVLYQLSMFLKITSGSISLSRDQTDPCEDQKYELLKILPYTCNVLQMISQNHIVLQKNQSLYKDYKKRLKILETLDNSYFLSEYEKIPTYYSSMLLSLRFTIFNTTNYLDERLLRENYHAISYVLDHFGSTTPEQEYNIKQFFAKVTRRIVKQIYKESIKYLIRLPLLPSMERAQEYDVMAFEFQLQINPGHPLFINPNSQVLISKTRQTDFSIVYLLNHLPNNQSQTLCNYAGKLTNQIQTSYEGRVILQEVIFRQQVFEMTPFHFFTQFNYIQTQQYLILFWPFLVDHRAYYLHQYAKMKYEPVLTDLIFIANRTNPYEPIHVRHQNQIQPRTGCTCFQVSNSDQIFIFGGFYSGLSQYIDFQNDITELAIGSEGITVQNTPKSFYYDTTLLESGQSVVTRIHNDFVRPRMQFEVYQKKRVNNILEIMLVGGIGEKYIRPHSILNHKAHLITFHFNSIQSIQRIKLNNVIVSNLIHPTRTVTKSCSLAIRNAQNRRLITMERKSAEMHDLTFSRYSLRFEEFDQRMKCKRVYQIAKREEEKDREWNILRELQKVHISLHTFQGKNSPQISIFFENTPKKDYKLKFEMDKERTLDFPNLQSNVLYLSLEDLLSIDTLNGQIYALIQHKQYTFGRPVLVRSEPYSMPEYQSLEQEFSLKQFHNFDKTFSKHALTVLPDESIAILHGYNFYQATCPEVILSKDKVGYYYSQQVLSSQPSQMIATAQLKLPSYRDYPKTSFLFVFHNQIICLSFLQINSIGSQREQVLMLVEELQQLKSSQVFRWKILYEFSLDLHFLHVAKEHFQKRIVDLCYQIQRKQNAETIFFTLLSNCEGKIFEGTFELEPLHHSRSLKMTMAYNENFEIISINEYKQKRINSNKQIKYAKFIDKTADPSAGEKIDAENQ